MPPKNSPLDRSIGLLNSASRLAGALQGPSTRNPVESRLRRDLVELAQEVARQKLTWGTSGHVSGRLGMRRFLISRVGTAFHSLREPDLIEQEIEPRARASEFAFDVALHRAIYVAQPRAQAVLQIQPPYITALVCGDRPTPPPVPEVVDLWSQVIWVDLDPAGEPELVKTITEAASKTDLILIQRRGLVCWSDSSAELLPLAQTLESVAQLVWLNKGG